MNETGLLGFEIYIPVPGTELHRYVNAVQKYFPGLGMQDASSYISAIMDAYPDASAARGVPYQKDTAAGEWMAQTIADDTGLSFGTVKGVLNVLQTLAAKGDVAAATYNPGKFSLSAKVGQAVTAAAAKAVSTAKAVTPDSIQKALEGAGTGIAGMGTLLEYLPLFVVGGLGIWAWQTGIFSKQKSRR